MGRRRNKNRHNGTLQNQTPHSTAPQTTRRQHILYNILDSKKDIIRLVRVHRQTDDPTLVVFSLEEHPIDEAPKYTAISYMWGPDTEGGSIELDGHMIRVRQNLYDFLQAVVIHRKGKGKGKGKGNERTRSLFSPNKAELFWVDTICINQNDVEERNHQVQMMGRIYGLANAVTVWLGRESDDSDYVFDTWDPQVSKSMKYQQKRYHTALMALIRREYWYRVWIRQEILKAKGESVFIHCGTRGANILLLATVCSIKSFGETLDCALGASPVADLIRREGFESRPKPLWRLLELYGEGRCCDVRDRIYSLLSLASDQEKLSVALRVDYSQSTAFLFWQTMAYLMDCVPSRGFTRTAKFIGKILDSDDQVACSIESWRTIQSRVGTSICSKLIQEFINLAKEAREIQAKNQANIRNQRSSKLALRPAEGTPSSAIRNTEIHFNENGPKGTPMLNQKQQEREQNSNPPVNTATRNLSAVQCRVQFGDYRYQHKPVIKEKSPAWLRLIQKRLDQNDWFHSLEWFNMTLQSLERASQGFPGTSAQSGNLLYWMDCIMNTLTLKVERKKNPIWR
jgi:hypothetical protein